MAIPYDGSCEAEYADGYLHSETEHNDVSPYDNTKNIFNDILEKRPEAEHGDMVRFSAYYKNQRYDVNWIGLPENARPVRYKKMEADTQGGQITEVRIMAMGFGYQYNDEQNNNIQEVQEII